MFDIVAQESPIAIAEGISQSDGTNLIVLKGSFSSGDCAYKFDLKSDGTGKIFYSDCPTDSEDFSHEVKVEELFREIEQAIKDEIALQSPENTLESSEIESIHQEITAEILEDVFWEEINQTLEDPFFRSSISDNEDWGEEFHCERGTTQEFIEFLHLCVLTEREIKDIDGYFIVEAETEIDTAGLVEGSYYTERLGQLVEIACQYYKPTGFYYDYNDGCYDRMSGYSMSSESVSISLAEFAQVPTRAKMLGMVELRKKLNVINVSADKIKELTAF